MSTAQLTLRGRVVAVLGLVLLVGGGLLRYPPVAALGGALVVLVLAERLGVSRPEPIELTRRISPLVVPRFGECTGTLTLTRGRTLGLIRAVASDLVAGVPLPISLPATSRAGETSVDYAIPTPRRGLVPVGPVRITRRGPTGMAQRVEDRGEIEQVRVLPREIPLQALPAGGRRATRSSVERVELGGTDLVGLHPYVAGDDLRRLHWATSAKVGSLMVREDADPSEPHLMVLLDDRAGSYPAGSDDFEDAVEIAAAVCRIGMSRGNAVHLQTASGRIGADVPASLSGAPQQEGGELSLLLAEVDASDTTTVNRLADRDLDTAVLVSGSAADEAELVLALVGAGHAYVVRIEAGPPVGRAGAATVIRGEGADAVAEVWDLAVPR